MMLDDFSENKVRISRESDMNYSEALAILAKAGVRIDVGLIPAEVVRIEHKFNFQFPPDLREFLSVGLPVSNDFVDWRHADEKSIQSRLDWPFEGMCFDIENNVFWLDEWGRKPAEHLASIEIARQACLQAPKLIPICSHRYISESPNEPGNPVFSIYQTDIIYYGADLLDYL